MIILLGGEINAILSGKNLELLKRNNNKGSILNWFVWGGYSEKDFNLYI